MAQIAVRGDQQVERRFSLREQLAVAQRRPALLVGGFDATAGQVLSQRSRRALIKPDTHAADGSGGLQAAGGVLEDGLGLVASHAREPGEELV